MGNIKELGRNLVNFAKTEATGVSYALSRGHPREAIERIVIGIPSDFKSLINETFHTATAVHHYTLIPQIDGKGRRDLRLRGYGSLRESGINFYLYNRRMQNREGMEAAIFQHSREKAFVNLLFSLREGETIFAFLPHGMEIEDGVAMARFTKNNGRFEAQSQLLPELSENEAECLLGGLEDLGGRRVFMSEGKNSPLWVGVKTRGEVFDLVERQEEFKGWTAGLLGQGFWQREVPACQDCKGGGSENLGSLVGAFDEQSVLRVPPMSSPSCGGSEAGTMVLPVHASRDSFQTLNSPSNEFGNFPNVKDRVLEPHGLLFSHKEVGLPFRKGEKNISSNSEKSLLGQLPVGVQSGENAFSTVHVSPDAISYRQAVDVAERRRQRGINIRASKEAPEFRLRDNKKTGETVVWEGVPIPLSGHGVIFKRTPEAIQKRPEFKPSIPTTEVIVARNMAEAVYPRRNTEKYIAFPELLVLPLRHFVVPDKQIPEMQFDVKDFVGTPGRAMRHILPLDSLPMILNDRGFAEAIGIRDKIRGKDTVLVNSAGQTTGSVLVEIPTIVPETHTGIVIVRSPAMVLSNLMALKYVSSLPVGIYESNSDLKPEEPEIDKLELAFEPALRRGRFGGGLGRYTPISIKLQYAVLWQKIFALFILSQKPKVSTVVFDRRVLAYDGVVRTLTPAWNFNGGNLSNLNLPFEDYLYGIIRSHSGRFLYATLS